MRTALALLAGAAALLGGCSHTPAPVQTQARSTSQDWILIAPPDNTVTVAFLNTFEYLPDGGDPFPGQIDGLTEQDRRSLQDLFEQVKAAPTPAAGLKILTELAAKNEAPVERWRRVRVFKSEEACKSTRAELLKVTDEQTQKFGAHAGMPREEFQWPLLARSFAWSRCVPEASETRGQG